MREANHGDLVIVFACHGPLVLHEACIGVGFVRCLSCDSEVPKPVCSVCLSFYEDGYRSDSRYPLSPRVVMPFTMIVASTFESYPKDKFDTEPSYVSKAQNERIEVRRVKGKTRGPVQFSSADTRHDPLAREIYGIGRCKVNRFDDAQPFSDWHLLTVHYGEISFGKDLSDDLLLPICGTLVLTIARYSLSLDLTTRNVEGRIMYELTHEGENREPQGRSD
nr:hypothetical protein Iba_chr03cCG2540 [Ipomoea batatas]